MKIVHIIATSIRKSISFFIVWAKVEAALKDAQVKADEFIKAKIEEYKPQIIEALNKFQEDVEDYKDFVIEESKKIYVRINKFGVQVVEDANAGE